MTTEQVIAFVKEKLGRDITEQEALDYINSTETICDEELDIVSGGGEGSEPEIVICPQCCPENVTTLQEFDRYTVCLCNACGKA